MTTLLALTVLTSSMFESTPKATVEGLFKDLNAGKTQDALMRVKGAKIAAIKKAYVLSRSYAVDAKFTPSKIEVKASSSTATVTVRYALKYGTESYKPITEKLTLERVREDWKLVSTTSKTELLYGIISTATDARVLAEAEMQSVKSNVRSSLKRIAVGASVLTAELGDAFKFNQANLREKVVSVVESLDSISPSDTEAASPFDFDAALRFDQQVGKLKLLPYTEKPKLWQTPSGKLMDVQFNSQLENLSVYDIEFPDKVVMLSIGKKGGLQYWGDETPIAFADGSVKFIKKSNVSKLLWR